MNRLLVAGIAFIIGVGIAYALGRTSGTGAENEEVIEWQDWAGRPRRMVVHRKISG